jgi:hypothetical protein
LVQKSTADPNVERIPHRPTICIVPDAWRHEHCFVVEPLQNCSYQALKQSTKSGQLQTSNSIESAFASVGHRSIRATGAASQYTSQRMLFALVMASAKPGTDRSANTSHPRSSAA